VSTFIFVEENKDLYYKALRRTQTTLDDDAPDWQPWLGFFLRCLKKQKLNLAVKVKQEKDASDISLPLLSVHVLKFLGGHEWLTISQIVEFTGANQNTLKVRLRELVNEGRIQRHGKARATWYSLL
jgi:Fic family protein